MAAYVILTCVLAWMSGHLVDRVWDTISSFFPTRFLAASLYYCMTMGWQPFLSVVVVRRWIDPVEYLDLGLNPTRSEVLFLGGLGAVCVAAIAMGITWLAYLLGIGSAVAMPRLEPQISYHPSLEAAVVYGIVFLGTVVALCTQAFSEELGWRGYFLPRMMQWLGPWPGLLVHGLVWGMWYAPVVALATKDLSSMPIRAVTFVVTLTLLGTVLGWLRLLTKSLSMVVVFNAVLTVTAGLPFILLGVDVGSRGSAYGPAGWVPLLLAAGVLFIGPARRAVKTPRTVDAQPRGPASIWWWVEALVSRNGHRPR